MMPLEGGLIYQIVTGLILAGAVYGGIRSDIKSMHEHLQRVEKSADQAHERIDRFGLGRRHGD